MLYIPFYSIQLTFISIISIFALLFSVPPLHFDFHVSSSLHALLILYPQNSLCKHSIAYKISTWMFLRHTKSTNHFLHFSLILVWIFTYLVKLKFTKLHSNKRVILELSLVTALDPCNKKFFKLNPQCLSPFYTLTTTV